jgi:hypothetical protein
MCSEIKNDLVVRSLSNHKAGRPPIIGYLWLLSWFMARP